MARDTELAALLACGDRLNHPDAGRADAIELCQAVERLNVSWPEFEGAPAITMVGQLVDPQGPGVQRPTTDFGRLTVSEGATVIVAGRMFLPGHPRCDVRRYEVGFVTVSRLHFPSWFPRSGGPEPVYWSGQVMASTSGLADPAVFGLFSELVSGADAAAEQRWAVLFDTRVEDLFASVTLPLAASVGLVAEVRPSDRTVALQAHEWGHWVVGYQRDVHREVDPVEDEWRADAHAAVMLWDAQQPRAQAACWSLVVDKLVRQAWYPTFGDRPDAIASRLLVRLALVEGAVAWVDGELNLDLAAVVGLLRQALGGAPDLDDRLTGPPSVDEEQIAGLLRPRPGVG